MQNLRPSLRPLPEGYNLSDWRICAATWFGSGLIKPASGTWGSLASLPFILLILCFSTESDFLWLGIFIVLTFFVGLYCSHYYMQISKKHDASEIVIDETCGLSISCAPLLMLEITSGSQYIVSIFFIFLLFRFFDAAKPFPIGWLDKKVKGALGVMIDDVVAGICAAIVFWAMYNWGIIKMLSSYF